MKLKSRRLLACLMAIVMVLTLLPFDPLEVRAAGTPTLDLGNPVRGAAPNYKLSNAAFGSTGVVDPGGGYFKVTVNNGSTALGTLPSGITELTDGINISTIITDKSTSMNRVFNFSSTTTYEDIRDVIRDLTFTQVPGQIQRVVADVTPGAQLADGKTSVRTYNGRYFVYVARPAAGNMTFYDALTAATNSQGHLVEPQANNPQETLAIASMFKEFKSYWKNYSGDGWSFISFIGATKTTAPNWNASSDTLTHYVSNTAQHTGLESTSEFYNNDPNYDHLTLVLNTNNTAVNYVSVRNIHGASTYKDPGVIVEYDPGVISIITSTKDIVLPAMGGSVAINGVPKVGETLTTDVTGITYTPNTTGNVPTYQWYRDGVAIANATDASYTLTAADINARITVEVTADGVHATGSVTSTDTAAIAAADGATAPTNVILDASAQTLSWNNVSGYPNASDYEYSLDGGATWTTAAANPQTLTSVPNPVSNAQVRVKEDTNAGRAPGTAGTATLPVMGGNIAISGVAQVGQELTANGTGITYTPNTTGNVPTYQWYRDGVAIANATDASYTLTAADIGGKITVEVTADGVHATGSVTSTDTAAVVAADGAAAPTNIILDASAQTLTWNNESGYPHASDYEYSLDGGATWTIATANPQTLTSVPNPVSNALVRVKEDTNAGRAPGAAGTATLPVMGGSVAIGGVAQVGQTLTASVTGITYTPNTTGNVPTYQWYRNGVAIANATGASYTLTAADIGGKITVEVTADGVHATGHVTSTETSPVAKADGPLAPGAPVEAGKTTTSITLTDTAGQEYSKDGGLTWQDSPTFSELVPDTEYSFVTRVKATATQSASSISEAAKIRTSTSASSGGVTPSATPKPDESGIETSVNGKDDTFATGKASTSGDRVLTSVQVDLEKLNQVLLESNGQKLAIHSPKDGDMKVEGLTAGTVKQLADKGTSLEISNPLALYPVPGGKMDLGGVSKQLGDAALGDIAVHIDIARSPGAVIANAKNKAAAEGYELLVTPVDLDLTFSHDGKAVRSEQLNGYAAKYIALPDGIDPNRITTGVIINEDGSVYHVPTVVTKVNNRYYAMINDLRSHGSYSVIWNPKDFDDLKQHWCRTDVNNIAARLDLAGNGDNTFSPNRNITRSEFSEIVVAGLGLKRQNAPQNKFPDVADSVWYRNSVAIANEFDIVRGYVGGNFYGDRQITREQGMAMIARASQLIEPKAALSQEQVDSLLAKYKDAKNVSAWAREDVARMIEAGIVQGSGSQLLSPQSNMTRAEVAALIARLLKTTNLIDK